MTKRATGTCPGRPRSGTPRSEAGCRALAIALALAIVLPAAAAMGCGGKYAPRTGSDREKETVRQAIATWRDELAQLPPDAPVQCPRVLRKPDATVEIGDVTRYGDKQLRAVVHITAGDEKARGFVVVTRKAEGYAVTQFTQ